MDSTEKYIKAAAKLQLALKVALRKGKFSGDVKEFISKIDQEVEKLIGSVDEEDILMLIAGYKEGDNHEMPSHGK